MKRSVIKRLIEANTKRTGDELREATMRYEDILESKADPNVMRCLALVYFKLYLEQSHIEKYGQQAVCWINRAIELAPKQPEFYVTRGDFLRFGVVDAPDYDQAAQDYRIALKINPDLVTACLGLASLEGAPEEVVSLKEAIVAVEHATVVQPDNSSVWLRLGTLYHKSGQTDKSFCAYRRALLGHRPLTQREQNEILQHIG